MTEDLKKMDAPDSRRPVWVRGFYMLLMLVVWQVAEAVLLPKNCNLPLTMSTVCRKKAKKR